MLAKVNWVPAQKIPLNQNQSRHNQFCALFAMNANQDINALDAIYHSKLLRLVESFKKFC
jgi:hypothetical protein